MALDRFARARVRGNNLCGGYLVAALGVASRFRATVQERTRRLVLGPARVCSRSRRGLPRIQRAVEPLRDLTVGGDGRTVPCRGRRSARAATRAIVPASALAQGEYRVLWHVLCRRIRWGKFSLYTGTAGAAASGSDRVPPTTTWGPDVLGAPITPALLRGLAVCCLTAAAGCCSTSCGLPDSARARARRALAHGRRARADGSALRRVVGECLTRSSSRRRVDVHGEGSVGRVGRGACCSRCLRFGLRWRWRDGQDSRSRSRLSGCS